jgi:Zn-dependent peptidase ImmA (M78 family)
MKKRWAKMIWLTNESADAVELFWSLAGEYESFPRTLEHPLALALPVALVKLPQLQLIDVENWLQRRLIPYTFDCVNRSIYGCLVAYSGKGIIFIDGVNSVDQLRFTIAHEIAHFLLDYWLPRRKAIQYLGASIVEVMDGLRSPSVKERLHSIMSEIPIGIHTNLLERNSDSDDLSTIWRMEDSADKVALALLAPPSEVLKDSDLSAGKFQQRWGSMIFILQRKYGLPEVIAKTYSLNLLNAVGKGQSWIESLGLR